VHLLLDVTRIKHHSYSLIAPWSHAVLRIPGNAPQPRKDNKMNRSEMICGNCIKFEDCHCRLDPHPVAIDEPDTHWCAQGQWQQWSEKYQEMEPFYWGEWEEAI